MMRLHEINAKHTMLVTTEQLFDDARTHHAWLDKPVPDELLQRLYDLMKWGPTSANCCPARMIFDLGYGDARQLHPRGPRLSFEEACRIA